MSYSFKAVITPETLKDDPKLFLAYIPAADAALAWTTYHNLTETLTAPDFPFGKFAERTVAVILSNNPGAESFQFHMSPLGGRGDVTVQLFGFDEKPSVDQSARRAGEVGYEKVLPTGSYAESGEQLTVDASIPAEEFRAEAARILCCLFNNNPGDAVREGLEFCNTIFGALKAGVSGIGELSELVFDELLKKPETNRIQLKSTNNYVMAKFQIGGSLEFQQSFRRTPNQTSDQPPRPASRL